MQHNEVCVCVTDAGFDEPEQIVTVGLNPDKPTYPDKLYWALLRFDTASLYFCYPDMAKHAAMAEQDAEYRAMRDAFAVPSMNGYERSFLKKKVPQDKNKSEAEDRIFWDCFKRWQDHRMQ
jgi:hypothetical protein